MKANKTNIAWVLVGALTVLLVFMLSYYLSIDPDSNIRQHEQTIKKLQHEIDSIQVKFNNQKSVADSLIKKIELQNQRIHLQDSNIQQLNDNLKENIQYLNTLDGLDSYREFTRLLDQR